MKTSRKPFIVSYSISSLNCSRTFRSSNMYSEIEWKYFIVLVTFVFPLSMSNALFKITLSLWKKNFDGLYLYFMPIKPLSWIKKFLFIKFTFLCRIDKLWLNRYSGVCLANKELNELNCSNTPRSRYHAPRTWWNFLG